jgi:hypothetical protein
MVTEDYRRSVLAMAEAIAPGWERRRSLRRGDGGAGARLDGRGAGAAGGRDAARARCRRGRRRVHSLAVWGPPERNPFFALIGTTCVQHGHLPPPDPAEPGIFNLADADRMQALLADAGFDDVRLEEVGVRFVFGSLDEYLDLVADTAGPLGLALRGRAGDERSAVAQELRGRLTPFATSSGYALAGVALAAVAS